MPPVLLREECCLDAVTAKPINGEPRSYLVLPACDFRPPLQDVNVLMILAEGRVPSPSPAGPANGSSTYETGTIGYPVPMRLA